MFVEGVASVNALLKAKWAVKAIAYDREKPLSAWAKSVLAEAAPDKILRLSSNLMEKLSDRDDPSELIVIAERNVRGLGDLRMDERSVVVIFDRPSNHGNLGSLIRSCDALGATGLVTMGHSVDIFEPAVLRASLGAFFSVPVIHCASPKELEMWIESVRERFPHFRVVGATADAERSASQVDLTGPVAIALGNEYAGISRRLSELVDESAAIPMAGSVDSLNVACAGTVMLYEALRQRGERRGPAADGVLSGTF